MKYKSPLKWPFAQKPRTPSDRIQDGRFSKRSNTSEWSNQRPLTIADARGRLEHELKAYGRNFVDTDKVLITTNVKAHKDGTGLYSNVKDPDDRGVAVYFSVEGRDVCLACDTFHRVADNIAAIAGHISADRKQARYGVSDAAQRYASYNALPAKGETSASGWREVFGIIGDTTIDEVSNRYRQMARKYHPDIPKTGDRDRFETLTKALVQAEDFFRA